MCFPDQDVVSLTPLPGNESQNLHRDGGNIDHIIASNCVSEYMCTVHKQSATCTASDPSTQNLIDCLRIKTVALTDFNESNGPTRLIPGSHTRSYTSWESNKTKGPGKPGSSQQIQDGHSGAWFWEFDKITYVILAHIMSLSGEEEETIFAAKGGSALLYDNRLVHGVSVSHAKSPTATRFPGVSTQRMRHCL